MSNTRDIDWFMSNPDEFDKLSTEDKAAVYQGGVIEGETTSATPDADETVTPAAEAVADEPKEPEPEAAPVLLAKDGQHTIPYEELLSARDLAKHYEQIARDQAALIEALKLSVPATPEAQAPTVSDRLAELQQEYAEAKLLDEQERAQEAWVKIQALIEEGATERARALVSQEFAQRDAQAQAAAAQASLDATVSKVIEAYPFLDSTKPTANAEAIADVVTWRDALVAKGAPMHVALAQAAAKFAPIYADPKPAPVASVADKAAEAIAKAKAPIPTSMSSIPSSATPHHDEAGAILEMNPLELQAKFMSMSPDQIEKLLARAI